MTIEKAKEICRHFYPVERDGKIRCISFDGGLCKLPLYFRCELLNYQDRVSSLHLSYSGISIFKECPRKFYFKNILQVPPIITPKYLIAGKVFEISRSRIDQNLSYDISEFSLELEDRLKLEVVLELYEKHAKKERLANELLLKGKYKDYDLVGYVDALEKDKIIEWKYTSEPENWNLLKINDQACIYFYLLPEINEIELCIAKKPREKLNPQKENEDAFKKRLQAKYDQNIFLYKTYFRNEFNIEQTLDNLVYLFSMQLKMRNDKRFPPNYNSCSLCDEYYDYCHSHLKGIPCIDKECKLCNFLR